MTGSRPALSETGSGEPVLLLAPAATRANVWQLYQTPALVSGGYRVLSYDTRGTNKEFSPAGEYRLADLAADAAWVIREAGHGPCHLVGASLGAMTAQLLASLRPDLVRSLTLLGTRARTPAFTEALIRAVAGAARDNTVSAEYSAASTLSQLFAPETLLDDGFAHDWLELMTMFPIRGDGVAQQYLSTLVHDEHADALATIGCPALVVSFEHDLLMPSALVREVAEAIPDARYREIPGTGHFGFLERPDEVCTELLRFLSPQRQNPVTLPQ
ncbi:alpha/beta fold hydrolase [Amycolatopsis sp. GA6-003]|uniref:alpha/beta fold hydrolase n=1 Tax=Amycolatopsis sp. GA6-003 TaxID=2652444 RepID=UPI00391753B4